MSLVRGDRVTVTVPPEKVTLVPAPR
jgi:hypothetical protein